MLKLAREIQPSGSICVSIEQECSIQGDEELLSEALGHLLRNAIEASPPAAQVVLSLTSSNDMAIIAVEDHGPGMSAEFIHKQLFKPFSSTKKNGFGIGAAEARDLIRSMDGDLEVLSVVGEGTRILATFPIVSQPYSCSI
jgi:signal transduction histidine kinase